MHTGGTVSESVKLNFSITTKGRTPLVFVSVYVTVPGSVTQGFEFCER